MHLGDRRVHRVDYARWHRSLVYRTYALDARNDAITRGLVMVHGAGRDADNGGTLTSAGGSVPG